MESVSRGFADCHASFDDAYAGLMSSKTAYTAEGMMAKGKEQPKTLDTNQDKLWATVMSPRDKAAQVGATTADASLKKAFPLPWEPEYQLAA